MRPALLCEGERARVGQAAMSRSVSGTNDVAARPDSVRASFRSGHSVGEAKERLQRHLDRTVKRAAEKVVWAVILSGAKNLVLF